MKDTVIFLRDQPNYTTEETKMYQGTILPISLNHSLTHDNEEYIVKKVDWDLSDDVLYITAYLK